MYSIYLNSANCLARSWWLAYIAGPLAFFSVVFPAGSLGLLHLFLLLHYLLFVGATSPVRDASNFAITVYWLLRIIVYHIKSQVPEVFNSHCYWLQPYCVYIQTANSPNYTSQILLFYSFCCIRPNCKLAKYTNQIHSTLYFVKMETCVSIQFHSVSYCIIPFVVYLIDKILLGT